MDQIDHRIISLNSENETKYKIQILKCLLNLLSLCYLCFGLIVIIGRICYQLDRHPFGADELQWEVSVFIMNIIHVLIFILIMMNKFVNNRHAVRISRTRNYKIVYFMATPMAIFAIVNNIIGTIDVILNNQTHAVLYFTLILVFIGILIVIQDVSSLDMEFFHSRPEKNKIFHNFTVQITIMATLYICSFYLVDVELFIFKHYLYLNFNLTFNSSGSYLIAKYVENIKRLFIYSVVGFSFVSIIVLLTRNSINRENINKYRRSVQATHASIIISVLFILIGLVPFPFLVIIKKKNENNIFISIMEFGSFMYILGIICSGIQLRSARKWKKLQINDIKFHLTDHVLVWFGLMGQIIVGFSYLIYYYGVIQTSNDVFLLACSISYMFYYIFQIVQSIMQTILIEISIERHWKLSESRSWFNPIMFLLSINANCFLMSLYKTYLIFTNLKEVKFYLFFQYTIITGEILGDIQRLHAIIFFFTMFTNMSI